MKRALLVVLQNVQVLRAEGLGAVEVQVADLLLDEFGHIFSFSNPSLSRGLFASGARRVGRGPTKAAAVPTRASFDHIVVCFWRYVLDLRARSCASAVERRDAFAAGVFAARRAGVSQFRRRLRIAVCWLPPRRRVGGAVPVATPSPRLRAMAPRQQLHPSRPHTASPSNEAAQGGRQM